MSDTTKKYLKHALHLAIVISLVVAANKYLNGAEIFEALRNFNYAYAPYMLIISLLYFVLKAWRFVILVRPITADVPSATIFKAYIAGQGLTLLPGGIAARMGLMKQVGVPLGKAGVPVALSSGLDQITFLLGSLIAALWFEPARTPVFIITAMLLVLIAILVIPTTRQWLAKAADRLTEKIKIKEQWDNFLEAWPEVVTAKVLLYAMVLTLVDFILEIAILNLALLGVDVHVTYPSLFLAFTLPTMLGRIFPIPGGVGVTEAGMVGFLASNSQLDPDVVAAAVAIFRIVTVLFLATLGAIVYFVSWRGAAETDMTADKEASIPSA